MSTFAALELYTPVPMSDELLDLALEQLNYDTTSLREAQSLAEAITNLEALRNSIKTFGFTASVMSFANHDGVLVNAIPELPALESFLADGSLPEGYSVEAAEEAILQKIKETASRWYTAIKDFIVKYKKHIITAIALATACAVAVIACKKYAEGKQVRNKEDAEFKRAREEGNRFIAEAQAKIRQTDVDLKQFDAKNKHLDAQIQAAIASGEASLNGLYEAINKMGGTDDPHTIIDASYKVIDESGKVLKNCEKQIDAMLNGPSLQNRTDAAKPALSANLHHTKTTAETAQAAARLANRVAVAQKRKFISIEELRESIDRI